MSRFDLDNMINQASVLLDEPKSTYQSSKQPRWQRKNDSQLYNSFNVSALNQTNNDLLTNLTLAAETNKRSQNTNEPHKTPGKTPNSKRSSQNSNKVGVTPAKTPNRHGNLKSTLPKTPNGGADRYITNRNGMDMEKSHYLMTQSNKVNQENDPNLRDRLGANLDQYRIMCYTDKAPVAPENSKNSSVLYSSSKCGPSAKKITRVIPSQPEKILDAPELLNDWYLNLVSWNSANVLAVALKSSVYLWNAVSGDTKLLFEMPGNDHVCSVSWIQEGTHLAIGTNSNFVEIWDCETQTRLRQMGGHSARVSALDWNAYTLSSGSKSGAIFHHDVRIANHHVGTLDGHEGYEICGLRWSPDGKNIASGANDNKVNIWSGSQVTLNAENVSPMRSFAHQAAVKAISWCPWKPHLIATGGGTTDRTIRVWNSTNGNCMNSVETNSQISGIEWNEEYQELVSGHGFENNTINIWKYPSLTKVAELRGHQRRILSLCMSPDRSTVVSLSADETLRFWECFPIDTQRKKKIAISAKKTAINPIRMSLR